MSEKKEEIETPEDMDIEFVDKEVAYWTTCKKNADNSLDNIRRELKFQEAVNNMIVEKLKEAEANAEADSS